VTGEPDGGTPGALPLEIDISVEAGNWPADTVLHDLCKTCVAAALETGLQVRPESELSIVFTDDEAIQKLNSSWRDKNSATNVLSFPASDPHDDIYGPLLGDIVLAYETVAREATELGIDFHAHVTHLVIHGFLHLFGYDHQDEAEAEVMENQERQIMAALGLDDPYADRPLLADGE